MLASATLLTIRTGGRVEPAIVLGADRTPRGFAYVSIVATNRATVSDVITIADVHFDDVTASPCPAANPVQRCARARVVCDGLAISLQALCPADDTTLAAMPSCEFDIVTVTSPKEAALVPAPTPDGGADGGVAPIPSVDAGVVDVGSVDAGAAPEPETAK